jgi:predicted RND superfamily exporter protein
MHARFLLAYANFVVRRPAAVLALLAVLSVGGAFGASRLSINSNQLDLISQDLPEVKDVKRLIDMVGGSGYLMLALRSNEEALMKQVADDLAGLLRADTENIRFVTYRTPVQFVQEKMVLFVNTEDLLTAKSRIDAFVRQKARATNPFFLSLRQPTAPTLDLSDLQKKYSHVGKKSILDDYYISEDHKMVLLLIKPLWDTNQLGQTRVYLEKIEKLLHTYSLNNSHGIKLVEDYSLMGDHKTMAYGFTGSYKTTVDDSYAISQSLEPVSLYAFLGILLITVVFFKFKWLPTLVVITGMIIGTLLTMGFAYFTVGQLNMITSILGGILMGFGVDYGIHFMFRTRIELGLGKTYDVAVHDALVQAGRPASVAAVVTGGSFLVLLVSQFRGFSQFGLLAGCGTLIIGLTMFSFSAAVLCLLGQMNPELPKRLIGQVVFSNRRGHDHLDTELHIKHPRRVLALCTLVVACVCAFAIPWAPVSLKADQTPTLFERLKSGVRFNYNTRALMPADQYSVKLQDEIAARFKLSSDPVAVYTQTLEQTKEVYDTLTQHPERYPDFDQVVSIYSFVPPPQTAVRNAAILKQWRSELAAIGFNKDLLPKELQDKMPLVEKIFAAQPYGIEDVPEVYASQFRHLPSTRPENRGYLTFIYPSIDLLDGKKMIEFAEQAAHIVADSGRSYHAAGLTTLYATLAKIVLWDGKLTVALATAWILIMHWLDFRSTRLALASVIPLGVGLVMMLGLMSLTNHNLNFMNIIMLPILLGFGVSHGLYLLHRFLEGTSPVVALRSVGMAVASSTLTAVAGFAALFAASHHGLKSMGYVACLGLLTTLVVSFTVLAAVLQLLYDAAQKAKPKGP